MWPGGECYKRFRSVNYAFTIPFPLHVCHHGLHVFWYSCELDIQKFHNIGPCDSELIMAANCYCSVVS
jgi:hypothetical protein